jgi:ribosomal protein L37AE/L43A
MPDSRCDVLTSDRLRSASPQRVGRFALRFATTYHRGSKKLTTTKRNDDQMTCDFCNGETDHAYAHKGCWQQHQQDRADEHRLIEAYGDGVESGLQKGLTQ